MIPFAFFLQLTGAQETTLRRDMRQILAIDEERKQITRNHIALDTNASVMRDEIASLKLRFPAIKIAPEPNSDNLDRSLMALRQKLADIALPIANLKQKYLLSRTCTAYWNLVDSRGWKSLNLQDRIDLMSKLKQDSGDEVNFENDCKR